MCKECHLTELRHTEVLLENKGAVGSQGQFEAQAQLTEAVVALPEFLTVAATTRKSSWWRDVHADNLGDNTAVHNNTVGTHMTANAISDTAAQNQVLGDQSRRLHEATAANAVFAAALTHVLCANLATP